MVTFTATDKVSTLGRAFLKQSFEAACGDVQNDGSEPFFISRKTGRRNVVHGDVRIAGSTMTCTYTRDDTGLDPDDVLRLFVIVYLEVFTGHYYRKDIAMITLRDAQSGATRTIRYADEAWLEPEW